jgi:hypothetical protein
VQSLLVAHGFSQVENKNEYNQHFKFMRDAPLPSPASVAACEAAIRTEVNAYDAKQTLPNMKLPEGTADDLITALHASGVKTKGCDDWMNTQGKSTALCDRDKGCDGALSANFPHAFARACTHHIEANVIKKCGRIPPASIWKIQSAQTEAAAEIEFNNLGKVNAKAASYLRDIPAKTWLAWPCVNSTSLREYKCSNAIEGINGKLAMEARSLCPHLSVASVDRMVMASLSKKRNAALLRYQKGEPLTKYAQELYNTQDTQSAFYNVQQSSGTRFFVTCSTGTDPHTHEIDLLSRTCSGGGCSVWFQFGVPCCHAIAAARHAGWLGPRYLEWLQLTVDPGYMMKQYLAILLQASVCLPNEGSLKPDGDDGDGAGAGGAGGQSNQHDASYAAAHAAAEAAAEAGEDSKGMADAYKNAREGGAGGASAGSGSDSGSGFVDHFTPQAHHVVTFDGKFNTKADLGITWAIDAPIGDLVVAVAGFTSGAGAGGSVELGDRLVAFGDIKSGHALLLRDLLQSAAPAMQIEALFTVTMALKYPVTLTFARGAPEAGPGAAHPSPRTLPNDPKAQPGRPTKKRIRHASEAVVGGMKQGKHTKPKSYKCSRCNSTEHTIKRCKYKTAAFGGAE